MNLQAASSVHMLRIKPSLDSTKLILGTDDGALTLSMPQGMVPFADQLGGLVCVNLAFMVVSEGGVEEKPPGGLILPGKAN